MGNAGCEARSISCQTGSKKMVCYREDKVILAKKWEMKLCDWSRGSAVGLLGDLFPCSVDQSQKKPLTSHGNCSFLVFLGLFTECHARQKTKIIYMTSCDVKSPGFPHFHFSLISLTK